MVNQKVAEIASQAAATQMSEMIATLHSAPVEEEKSVYAKTFEILLKECNITPEVFRQRVREYVEKNASKMAIDAAFGNMMKESTRPEMNHKIFKRLVQAVFPAE
jgi:hypothetical protein